MIIISYYLLLLRQSYYESVVDKIKRSRTILFHNYTIKHDQYGQLSFLWIGKKTGTETFLDSYEQNWPQLDSLS